MGEAWFCQMCEPIESGSVPDALWEEKHCPEHGLQPHYLGEAMAGPLTECTRLRVGGPDSGGRRTGSSRERPTVHQYVMGLCARLADRSTCPDGRRHAAVIMMGTQIVATGYNGPPRGWDVPDSCELRSDELGKDFRRCPCVHAEVNAVVNAARAGVSILGGVMFCTKKPCAQCALILDNCGLTRIYYAEE